MTSSRRQTQQRRHAHDPREPQARAAVGLSAQWPIWRKGSLRPRRSARLAGGTKVASTPVEWGCTGRLCQTEGLAQAVVLAATGEPDADVWGHNWLVHGTDGQNLGHKSGMVRQPADADSQGDDPTDQ